MAKSPHSFTFFILYNFLLVGLVFVDSFLFYWLMMELSTLVFMGFSYSVFKNNFSSLLIFFIVQAVSAFCLFVFYLMTIQVGFTVAILLKLSMFPFYFWYMGLVLFFPNFVFMFASTLFKLPSILLLLNFCEMINYSVIFFSGVVTILVGAAAMVYSNDLRFILVASSVANNTWFVMAQLVGFFFFMMYLLTYSLFLYVVVSSFKDNGSSTMLFHYPHHNHVIFFSILNMSGLPPFPLFFFKMLIVLNLICLFNNTVLVLFMMIVSVFLLLGYLKFIFSTFIITFYPSSPMENW